MYLEQHGLHAPDLVEKMHGKRNDEIVAAFWGNNLTAEENFQHGAAKEALWRKMMEPELESHLVPGVRTFLEHYSESPIGLATNAEPANATFVLHRANLSAMFKVIVDGMQVAKPKPYPDVYCRAADLLGVAPSNCIVFEDSPTGVQAARAAGMRVVGIRTHVQLEGVELSVDNFLDPALEEWLAQQTVRSSS
jgi:beta-phosphoglucomutase